MEYSYKFRLYPNREQEKQILRTLGCCRFVFNHYLAKRKEVYAQDGKTLNYYDCAGDMTQLKKSLAWLREVDATALQSSLRDLDTAFQNFFRRVKQGEKSGYPRFKSKHNHRQSYKSKCVGTNIKILDHAVQLPKLGHVKCHISKEVKGRILSATVSQNASGKYFVALCCTDVEIAPLPSTGAVIGLDMGLKSFILHNEGDAKTRAEKELEAESAAFVICSHYGIDTSEYTFPYLASWCRQERDKLERCLDAIQKHAFSVIEQLDASMLELEKAKADRSSLQQRLELAQAQSAIDLTRNPPSQVRNMELER